MKGEEKKLEEVLKNAKIFAKVLAHNGINSCLVNEHHFPARQVIIKWDKPEGARAASCRLAKVGVYVKAIRLEGDLDVLTGLHFSLTGLTRLRIKEEDLRTLAATTANVLLGYSDLVQAKTQIQDISSRLSPFPRDG